MLLAGRIPWKAGPFPTIGESRWEMDRNALAVQVVDLARARVLSKNHFLSAAVGRLGLEAAVLGEQFVTDGYELYFDPSRVISSFRAAGVPPEHDLLHCVAH